MEENQQNLAFEVEDTRTKDCSSKVLSKFRIVKNVCVICLSYLLSFIAYDGLSVLQSTMNRKQGIGVASQAILYMWLCISSIFLPKYIIKKLGSKRTSVLAMATYIPYIASNFYFHWGLVIPTSILVGVGAPMLLGSQAVYLNDISVMYANTVQCMKKKTDSILNRSQQDGFSNNQELKTQTNSDLSFDLLNIKRIRSNDANNVILQSYNCKNPMEDVTVEGIKSKTSKNIFFMDNCQQCFNYANLDKSEPQINCGCVKSSEYQLKISINEDPVNIKEDSLVPQINLEYRTRVVESTTARFFGFHSAAFLSSQMWGNLMSYYILQSGVTDHNMSNSSCICGSDFCNIESECFEHNIGEPSTEIRYVLTSTCVCISIVSILVIGFFLDPLESEMEEITFSTDLLMATYEFGKKKACILLIPSSFYTGMVIGFYLGDFTKAFVGCAWGTYHVALVSICYGAVSGISSSLSGFLVKRLGRIPVFTSATLVNIATNIFLLLWRPSAEEPTLFFLAAALWGIYVAVIYSQVKALYGILFKADEEAAFAVFHVWYSLGSCLSFAYSNYVCIYVKLYVMLIICILGYVGYIIVEILHLKNKEPKC